jgi:hypothetical protein
MTESGKLIDFGRTEDVANVTAEQLDNFFLRFRNRFDYEMNEPHESLVQVQQGESVP